MKNDKMNFIGSLISANLTSGVAKAAFAHCMFDNSHKRMVEYKITFSIDNFGLCIKRNELFKETDFYFITYL